MPDPRTKEGREELRRIASSADSGPWRVSNGGQGEDNLILSPSGTVGMTFLRPSPPLPNLVQSGDGLSNATHIAAFDPITVLALLDIAEEQDSQLYAVLNGGAVPTIVGIYRTPEAAEAVKREFRADYIVSVSISDWTPEDAP